MARRRHTQWAEQILAEWASGPKWATIDDADKALVEAIVEGLRPLVLQQGERSVIAALDLEDLLFANLIARRADVEALKRPTKENVEMAIKTSERKRKTNAAMAGTAAPVVRKESLGIGSRMRPLIKKAAGAFEAAIAETERRRRAAEEGGAPE